MREAIAGKLVGQRVRRTEDRRLLTGNGRYVDDVQLPGMLHASFARSPHAHANIRDIFVADALKVDGVIAIITGEGMASLTNPFMGMLGVAGLYDPRFYSLAYERVRHVGDPVAIVIANSRRVAEDACELIDVDYEVIDPIANIGHALDSTRPLIWDHPKSNVMLDDVKNYGQVDAAFASADRVITHRFHQHRISNQPMETRGIVVEIERNSGDAIVHAATQNAHGMKWSLALMSDRQTVRQSIKDLATNRDRLTTFVNGAKALITAKPQLKEPSPMMPIMAKQMKSEPRRLVDMQRAMFGLLARGSAGRPEIDARDIGGAFGTKGSVSREEMAVYAAARHLNRSIKWIEDRNEHLMVGGHAREEFVDFSLAVKHDGTIVGMKADLTIDGGAYPAFPFGAAMFAQLMRVMIPGPYRVPALGFRTRIVATNKGTYVAYRGPWAVETFVRERMFDLVARELNLSRAEVRLRNIVGADELPTPLITGPMLDIRMSAKATLDKALEVSDFANWEATKTAARAEGKILGCGLATFIEAAPGPPGFMDHVIPGAGSLATEPANLVLEADGTVSVLTQQVPHGQGHETTLAQITADELGVPIEQVRVRYGDTRVTPFAASGTGGSRSAALAGGVVTLGARELREKVLDIAEQLLEASRDDITIEDGNIHVAGVPARGITFGAVAQEALRSGGQSTKKGEAIRVTREYDGGEGGWSQSTHVCWVEIDLETGIVTIPRYAVVEDCGELINPAIVDGQIRGGVAQGIGAVLYEKISYDEQGQFQTGTFMDYLIPTTMEIPDIEIYHVETPSDIVANYRGVGEGGMIAAPAALTNAIEDALAHLGVKITEQHLPPTRILELAGVIPTS